MTCCQKNACFLPRTTNSEAFFPGGDSHTICWLFQRLTTRKPTLISWMLRASKWHQEKLFLFACSNCERGIELSTTRPGMDFCSDVAAPFLRVPPFCLVLRRSQKRNRQFRGVPSRTKRETHVAIHGRHAGRSGAFEKQMGLATSIRALSDWPGLRRKRARAKHRKDRSIWVCLFLRGCRFWMALKGNHRQNRTVFDIL